MVPIMVVVTMTEGEVEVLVLVEEGRHGVDADSLQDRHPEGEVLLSRPGELDLRHLTIEGLDLDHQFTIIYHIWLIGTFHRQDHTSVEDPSLT